MYLTPKIGFFFDLVAKDKAALSTDVWLEATVVFALDRFIISLKFKGE